VRKQQKVIHAGAKAPELLHLVNISVKKVTTNAKQLHSNKINFYKQSLEKFR
jgi:hypothetical protein